MGSLQYSKSNKKGAAVNRLFCILAVTEKTPMKIQPSAILVLLIVPAFIVACTTPPQKTSTIVPTPALVPSQDPLLQSNGGGEPRSPDYWLIWNTCAEGTQAAAARANGGREAGWILMDDLLVDPGILVGTLQIETCQQGVSLLRGENLSGTEMKNDAAYILASQLFTAQLNLATGSEYCPASDQAVSQAQLLLLELNFNGTGGYLGPPLASSKIEDAQRLMDQLASYNSGSLCQ